MELKIYISGAIANDERAEEKFAKAEKELLEKYHETCIVNPVKLAKSWKEKFAKAYHREPSPANYLEFDIIVLGTCTHFVRLDDGIASKGADIETLFAAYAGLERLPDHYVDLPRSLYECLVCGNVGAVAKCCSSDKRKRIFMQEDDE